MISLNVIWLAWFVIHRLWFGSTLLCFVFNGHPTWYNRRNTHTFNGTFCRRRYPNWYFVHVCLNFIEVFLTEMLYCVPHRVRFKDAHPLRSRPDVQQRNTGVPACSHGRRSSDAHGRYVRWRWWNRYGRRWRGDYRHVRRGRVGVYCDWTRSLDGKGIYNYLQKIK